LDNREGSSMKNKNIIVAAITVIIVTVIAFALVSCSKKDEEKNNDGTTATTTNDVGEVKDIDGFIIFKGQVVDGRPGEWGTWYNRDSKKPEKEIKEDGTGFIYDKNGNVIYEGQFKNQKQEGQGKQYYNVNNEKTIGYEGQYKNGKKDGLGKWYMDTQYNFIGVQLDFKTNSLFFEGTFKDDIARFGSFYYEDSKKLLEVDEVGNATFYDRNGSTKTGIYTPETEKFAQK
jgi:antitoxin component YwqK of YwqJK toxin-antitoxin module